MDANIIAKDNPRFLAMIAYLSIYAMGHDAVHDIETLYIFLTETLRVPYLNINKLNYLVYESEKYSWYFNVDDSSYITLTVRGKLQLAIQRVRDAVLSVSIYQLYNAATERSYIGQARDPEARWQQHLRELRKGTHINEDLQEDFNYWGEDVFSCRVLEEKIPLYLSCNYEHYYCQEYDADDSPIYNTAPIQLKLNAFKGCEPSWI